MQADEGNKVNIQMNINITDQQQDVRDPEQATKNGGTRADGRAGGAGDMHAVFGARQDPGQLQHENRGDEHAERAQALDRYNNIVNVKHALDFEMNNNQGEEKGKE